MGLQTIVAGLALLIATGLLIYFFVTESEAADAASNWFFLVFYGFMAWTVIDVHRFYADSVGLMWLITVVVLIDLALLFLSTLLIVLNRVDFRVLARSMTLAFLVVMLWMFLVSVIVIVEGGLPVALGWFGVFVLSAAATVVGVTSRDREVMTGEKMPGPGLRIVYGAVLVGLTTWIVWLGIGPMSLV